jgi:TonB family protein
LPVKDAPRESANPNPVQIANVPSNPQLARWAGRVQMMVEQKWKPPAGIDAQRGAKTVVSFEVERSGKVSSVEVAQSSGNTFLDDQALGTIKRLERVAPIPESFPGDLLKVSYEFIYNAE